MTDLTTVKLLAAKIQTSVDRLVQQFADAGIQKHADDLVTTREKQILLTHLNREYGSLSDSMKFQRKTRSTLNISGIDGKNKSIKIEIRKTRTFPKRYNLQEEVNHQIEKKQKQFNETKDLIKDKENTKKTFEFKSIETSVVYDNINNEEKASNQAINNGRKTSNQQINEITNKTILPTNVHHKNKIITSQNKIVKKTNLTSEENKTNSTKVIEDSKCCDDSYYESPSKILACHIENIHEINSSHNNHRFGIKSFRDQKKKGNKQYLESKDDREEARTVIRSSKNDKRKSVSLHQNFQKSSLVINRNIVIGETITVGELASKMAVKSSQLIKIMMKLGAMVTINEIIDQETAQLVIEEMGHKAILRRENDLEEAVMSDRDMGVIAEKRAPVVTVMGHVDHGKTSLLDYIRSTKVVAGESGGITQHIGAYNVKTKNGFITFLDTPGHAAFTSMRVRGVQITDIVVLVVAADDGVMPQTIEAVQHAKAAGVPIIVAVNKIDKPEADLNRVKNDLSHHGIIPEEWGGENQFVYLSATQGINIDALLDAILLQSEMLELKAIRKGMACGVVIESLLDKGRGPIATVLVREGTLHKGDIVLCGLEYGRVRAMRNELGQEVLEAGPSIPVEILGISGVPMVGDKITVVRDEKKAREVALYRQGKFRTVKLTKQEQSKLENMFTAIGDDKTYEVNIVLKADVQGSVEAISDSLIKLSSNKVKLKIISSGVGGITGSDATLAATSNAILLGFNVRTDSSARRVINLENLNVYCYSVIYKLIDSVKSLINGMLSPELKKKLIGLAEVRDVFKSPKFGTIAGCMVIEGIIRNHNPIRVLRNNSVVYEGELESLRRFKDDVKEVRNGMECGIGVKNYSDVNVGDIIEVFELIEVQPCINSSL